MLIDYAHFFTFSTYHGLGTSFFWAICLILFSTRYFYYRKVKGMFSHLHHFLEIRLDHPMIFLYGDQVESELRIFCYRLSIDLVIVLFSTPHSFYGSLIEFF